MSYHTIAYSNKLALPLRKELERIFFFNLNQSSHLDKIQKTIESDGLISIIEEKDHLKLQFEKSETESLFALDSEKNDAALLGVICYKFQNEKCHILHIAVDPDCATKGHFESELLTYRLIEKVRKIAVNKRVESLVLPYTGKEIKIKQKIIDILE
ncbi:MAG: hypothetical protein J0L60_10050 [Ignavibacteria bacterium]|nr:hypothetical protein [Ignavibacteria bacterium]